MELLETIKKAAVDFDSTIQNVTMKQGPGSDGPYIQPEYYAYVTYEDGKVTTLGLYHNTSWKDYHFPAWGTYNPPAGLLEAINEAIQKETDLKSKTK